MPKFILDNISTLSTSADQIWDHLDKKFGNTKIVAKEIMKEVEALDHKKLGKTFMPKFTILVNDAYASLDNISELDWLTSKRATSELEDQLPNEEKAEWAKFQTTLPGDNDFTKFRKFLDYRKEILDAVDSMGHRKNLPKPPDRPDPNQKVCDYCGMTKHLEEECRAKQRDDEAGTPGASRGSKGSIRGRGNERDQRNQRHGARGRGTGRGGGYGRTTNNIEGEVTPGQMTPTEVELNSNTMRSHACNRCKMASNLQKCNSCQKTNPNHCIAHCEKYITLAVDDRVNIIKTSQSCAVCLHPSHKTDACKLKDSPNYICGMNQCTSHHHPTLHGSKDPFTAKMNVLIAQQSETVLALSQGEHAPVIDWQSRAKYEDGDWNFMDSLNEHSTPAREEHKKHEEMEGTLVTIHENSCHPNQDVSASLSNAERLEQLEEVKRELHKRQIEGEKVLMTTQEIKTIYGSEGTTSKVITFFDDGSNCSVIRSQLAEEMKK